MGGEQPAARGHPEDRIIVTGNTVIDAFRDVAARPFELDGQVVSGVSPEGKRLGSVATHPRGNFGQAIWEIYMALRAVAADHEEVTRAYERHLNPNFQNP